MERNLLHLVSSNTSNSESFTSPQTGPRDEKLIPARQPHSHGAHLIQQLGGIESEYDQIRQIRLQRGLEAGGLVLEFESDPNFELIYKSLENERKNIELLNVNINGDRVKAVVLVPEGELSFFINRIEQYLKEPRPGKKRKNANLVESIANIRRAVLKALWTDAAIYFPRNDEEIWWEIWLRCGNDREAIVDLFQNVGQQTGMEISAQRINFIDRTVLLVKTRESVLQSTFELLDILAELRRARVSANEFLEISTLEQKEWVNSIHERLVDSDQPSCAISMLDTGVNNGHPLLLPFLQDEDLHAFNPDWGTTDQQGHGTEMAGIAIFGDLGQILEGEGEINVPYCLESVKILPSNGVENDPQLYGYITDQSVSRLVVFNPDRKRVFAMAITAGNLFDYGKPSSWSASVDNITSNVLSDDKKLFIISVGNVTNYDPQNYLETNFKEQVEDPAQAWNAIAVGAITHKAWVDEIAYPNWHIVASHGELSPSSRTSVTWNDPWPYKPDVVMEGGNQVWNPDNDDVDTPASLSVLTTYYHPAARMFTASGDTSAATYLVAKVCANLLSQYHNLWPETVRALIVHSAEWSDQMIRSIQNSPNSIDVEKLVRTYGYGEVNENRALFSARNSPTVIIENELQPFILEEGRIKTNEMHVHKIPWPTDELLSLGDTEVTLRVTLSYFIEPNPASRGWNIKHTYASYGLRFEVKTPTESIDEFRRRVNKAAREEGEMSSSKADSKNWFLGQKKRSRGSLHSDIWRGTAADLAEKGYIVVYPITGWWRTRRSTSRWRRTARYSLVFTLEAANVEIDLYSAIEAKIRIPVKIPV